MEFWTQNYTPLMNSEVVSAVIAGIPLYLLFYMLAVRSSAGHYAAILATSVAVILAISIWGMPVGLALNATVFGAAFGLFPIIWIVVTAV